MYQHINGDEIKIDIFNEESKKNSETSGFETGELEILHIQNQLRHISQESKEDNLNEKYNTSQQKIKEMENIIIAKTLKIAELQQKLHEAVHMQELLSEDLLQSKQIDNCASSKIAELQKELDDKIQKHSEILSEWESDNRMIVSLANSASIADTNIENNEDDDDMKQMILPGNQTSFGISAEALLNQHLQCNILVLKQQKRLKTLPMNIRQVFQQQGIIRVLFLFHEKYFKHKLIFSFWYFRKIWPIITH